MKARIVETDLSVPVAKGPWWYYERTLEGRDYVIHCRLPVRSTGLDATPPSVSDGERPDEQVLLDENVLAEGHGYLDVANLAVSPGHSRLAYASDTTGDEHFTLQVRDLESGDDLDDAIEGTSYGVAWANDDNTVFFTRPDAANRPFQLWRHRVGSPPEAGRPRRGRTRRAVPPRRRADQGRRLRGGGDALPDHLGGPRHPRRPARGGPPGRAPTRPGGRVRHRAPRRHVHRAHQRPSRELQGRGHSRPTIPRP